MEPKWSKNLNQFDNFISSRTLFPQIEYKERHHRIVYYIQWKVCKYSGMLDLKNWHKDKAEPILQAKRSYYSLGLAIQTNGKIKSNKPETLVKDYRIKTHLLIDLTGLTDNNISVKDINFS